MSGRYPMVVVAVLLVLLGINLWLWPNTDLQLSTTSFGVGGEGYKAAYDLLSELGLPVSRSYAALSQVPEEPAVVVGFPVFARLWPKRFGCGPGCARAVEVD